MKKRRTIILLIICLQIVFTSVAFAEVPYESYNFDYWDIVIPSPASYEPVRTISGLDLGIDPFSKPTDLFVTDEGKFYLLDSGNARIVIFNEELKLINIISSFLNQGIEDTFKNPSGITLDKEGKIYVADTDNNRVVTLSKDGKLDNILENPKSELFPEDFKFLPTKVAVDEANRVYVVAKNVFEGMMHFDQDGQFSSYFGTIKVQYNVADMLWRKIATKEQRKKMILFIPTEYTNVDIDSEGFVYATNIDYQSTQTINRLNPSGKDVLKKYSNNVDGIERAIIGDIRYRSFGKYSGPSAFVDIKAQEKGLFTALDSTRGRIYTYDSEGNLLYIFGGLGNQVGMFKLPAALEVYDEYIYVLDQGRGELTKFKPTAYGALINKAIKLRYDGNEAQAVECWEEVLKHDANYQLAYSGIGKSLLAANKNKEAMHYLKLGMDKKYYSVAYKRYRNEILKQHSGKIFTGIFLLLGMWFARKTYMKIKRRRNQVNVEA